MNILKGYRTYIAAAGLVIAALVQFLGGDATLGDTVLVILNGLGLAALRNAV